MSPGIFLVIFLAQTAVLAVSLWCAMKLSKEDGPLVALLGASFAATLMELIPYVGWWLPLVVLLAMISKWTTAEVWPDAVAHSGHSLGPCRRCRLRPEHALAMTSTHRPQSHAGRGSYSFSRRPARRKRHFGCGPAVADA